VKQSGMLSVGRAIVVKTRSGDWPRLKNMVAEIQLRHQQKSLSWLGNWICPTKDTLEGGGNPTPSPTEDLELAGQLDLPNQGYFRRWRKSNSATNRRP